jgi:hypothetical protein
MVAGSSAASVTLCAVTASAPETSPSSVSESFFQ